MGGHVGYSRHVFKGSALTLITCIRSVDKHVAQLSGPVSYADAIRVQSALAIATLFAAPLGRGISLRFMSADMSSGLVREALATSSFPRTK